MRLKIKGQMAQIVKEKIWVENQTISETGKGEILFQARMRGMMEIVNWILGMKGDALVLEPEELVKEVKKEAREVLGRYNSSL